MLAGSESEREAPPLLSWRARLGYGLGSVGTGVYSTVPSVLLLYFMTQVLRLPVALAPIAVLAPKLVIVLAEPMVGAWSDATRGPWGRRAPFLLAGAVVSALAFVTLFASPRLAGPWPTLAWVGLAYLAASLAFSLFSVPYVAMPAEMSADTGERIRIISWRMTFVFLGVLLGAALPPLLVYRLGGGARGYLFMAVVVAAIALPCMIASFFTARSLAAGAAVRPAEPSARLSRVLGFGPYVVSLALYVAIMIGFGASASAGAYFVTFALGANGAMLSALLTAQLVTALIVAGPCGRLTARLGFAWTLRGALLVAVGGCLILYAAALARSAPLAFAGSIVLGLANGAVQVASFALLADVTGRAQQAGLRVEGLMTGLWTALEKVALAIGPLITGAVLAAGGFISAVDRGREPASAIAAAGLAMTAAPGAVFVLALAASLGAGRFLNPRAGGVYEPSLQALGDG